MSEVQPSYERVVDSRGIVRFKLNGKLVKALEVPENIRIALEQEAIVTAEDTAPSEEDSVVEVKEAEVDPAASPDDVDDDSGLDEEFVPTPQPAGDSEGFGFKRLNGKTVDIFNDQPHETIKFVEGLTVPLTMDNYEKKTDAEILAKLKKLGKV